MDTLSANIADVANKTFDYLIIGGGTTGSALASRLTESPSISVLVLEAGIGRVQDPLIDMPTGFPQQFGNPGYDWGFQTVPQARLGGKIITWNRGKGLGGSSNINYMAWTRPGKDDIDAWERLGNPGWNWDTFLPYVKKAENFHFPPNDIIKRETIQVEPSSFGSEGPISISFSDMLSGAEPIVRQTLQNRGVPIVPDPYNGKYPGTWCSPASVNPETLSRSTAFKSYLLPNLSRKNLTIVTEAYVTRLILDEKEVISAKGVEFVHGHKTYNVFAGREVILCAGALKSPQILELSGIGDSTLLKSLGIDVKLDLPAVGTNLQDHFSTISLAYELRNDANVQTLDILSDPVEFNKFSELYAQQQRGLLSLTVSGLTFVSAQTMSENAKSIIDKHEKHLASHTPSLPGLREQYQIQLEHLKDPQVPDCEIITNPIFSGFVNKADPGKRYVSFIVGMIAPWSRGTAHIISKDPFEQADLDPNYLAEDIDLELITEAFKFARSLSEYEPFNKIICEEVNPGPTIKTDEQIKAHIKESLNTLWHTTSTLSMLPKEKGGVVDPSLKVWGTKNIRVCDISIIPLKVGVHTQSVAYGIAERAADIILDRI